MDTNKALIDELKNGGIAVIPTDTLYGIVASALIPSAVENVYRLRRRNPAKPCIILIADKSQLSLLGIDVDPVQEELIDSYWPGPVSIILPTTKDCEYLHRDTKTLAIRMPNNRNLRELIRQTGPLIAPSANHEGLPPAQSLSEAHTYFGSEVAIYIDGGTKNGAPSGLIDLSQTPPLILRPVPTY
jgi:L-threonylcarbamoyladenylate synthase